MLRKNARSVQNSNESESFTILTHVYEHVALTSSSADTAHGM